MEALDPESEPEEEQSFLCPESRLLHKSAPLLSLGVVGLYLERETVRAERERT